MGDKTLRKAIIRLAHENPELRADLLPLVSKQAAKDMVCWEENEAGDMIHFYGPTSKGSCTRMVSRWRQAEPDANNVQTTMYMGRALERDLDPDCVKVTDPWFRKLPRNEKAVIQRLMADYQAEVASQMEMLQGGGYSLR